MLTFRDHSQIALRLKMGGDPYRNKFEEEVCHGKKQDPSGKNDIKPGACVIL